MILTEPKWLKALNEIYTEENLTIIKDYIEIINIGSAAPYLGEDFEKAATAFNNAYLGSQGDIPQDGKAINMVNSALGEPFGKIYIQKYFSDKVKNDVTDITNEVISTYKKVMQLYGVKLIQMNMQIIDFNMMHIHLIK